MTQPTRNIKGFWARLFCWHDYHVYDGARFVGIRGGDGYPVYYAQCAKCGSLHTFSVMP